MVTKTIAKAMSGGDTLPTGEYAALVKDSHIETQVGNVPLPKGQNLLNLCIGHGKIAGIGGKDDQAWVYDAGVWTSHGLAYGPNAVLLDAAGALRVIHTDPPVGYRYATDDNVLVTCAATYADQARHIWEYTTRGDITVGQGGKGPLGEDPAIALLSDGTYRLLSDGCCRQIRFHRLGDLLSVSWMRQDTNAIGLIWLTVAELRACPIYQPPGVTPVATPPALKTIKAPTTIKKPAIRSPRFDGIIRDGWHWVLSDGNNPQFGTVDLSVEEHDGGLYIRAKLTNAAGVDQSSGTKRRIR